MRLSFSFPASTLPLPNFNASSSSQNNTFSSSSHNAPSFLKHKRFLIQCPHPLYQLLPHTNDLSLKQCSFPTRMPLLNSLSQAIGLHSLKTTSPHLPATNTSSSLKTQTPPHPVCPSPLRQHLSSQQNLTHHPQTIKRVIMGNEDTFLTH